ncbi:DUF805 domain-containing protein [Ramlibacter sp. MMS24-I3-19]|uniref:DUF805 domain-containing protein n=1 Tax=Ramlibacter sp. MMS24-I3-19 TaxID=3416606 RepID=UPI003CFFA492
MEEFQHAVKTCFNKYADFSGRAARPEFWWFFAFQFAVYVVTSFVHGLIELVAFLALVVPGLAVGARRMHDTGKSGWILLLALIPVVGGLVLLFFAAQPGEPHDNAYGPVPTGGGQPALAPGQQ